MEFSAILFYVVAALMLFFATMMVVSTNLVHSALYMVVAFVGVAAVYAMLSADFLAAVQLLVYVGAISVLLVFGVMLTRRGDIRSSNPFNRYKYVGLIVVAALFGVFYRFVALTEWPTSEVAPASTTVAQIADLLLNQYVVHFEAAAILLLVAMVGAIIIGKGVSSSQ